MVYSNCIERGPEQVQQMELRAISSKTLDKHFHIGARQGKELVSVVFMARVDHKLMRKYDWNKSCKIH